MDVNAVEQFKNVLSSITIEKDQTIYEEGEPLVEGYILSLGKVQLFKNTSDAKLADKQTIYLNAGFWALELYIRKYRKTIYF